MTSAATKKDIETWPIGTIRAAIAMRDVRFRAVRWPVVFHAQKGESVAEWWARQPYTPNTLAGGLSQHYPIFDSAFVPAGVSVRLRGSDEWVLGKDLVEAHERAVLYRLIKSKGDENVHN